MKKFLASVLLSFTLVSCGNATSQHTAQKHQELTYATYYDQAGPTGMDPCTFVKHSYLDKSNPAQPYENFYFTCEETGKNPTIAQQQFWIEYVLAKSCDDGEKLACDADVAD